MNKPTTNPTAPIVWGFADPSHRAKQGYALSDAERQDREAWPSQSHKSAYTHLLNLPDHVEAGDGGHARLIMDRLDRLTEQGGWTTTEFNRLYQMRKAWARREAGKDPVFNMRGWDRKGKGHNLPPTLKALREIGEALDSSRQVVESPFKTKVKRG